MSLLLLYVPDNPELFLTIWVVVFVVVIAGMIGYGMFDDLLELGLYGARAKWQKSSGRQNN